MILSHTESLCPVCLTRLPAAYVAGEDDIRMEKSCPVHGFFSSPVWQGNPAEFKAWLTAGTAPSGGAKPTTALDKGCPYDCGLCPSHAQKACCILFEVTERCNLSCPVCFAQSGENSGEDPSLEAIGEWFSELMALGGPFNIQLSGGEPTMRDDLADIIRLGRDKGFSFFQLNTNGIRLAEDPAYLKELVDAGLNTVFLQFDGLRSETHESFRGRDLRALKKKAIAHCRQARVGVILVPVLSGDNIHEVGDILRFALEQMPTVRGVHFQPMAYFGRYPGGPQDRVTLPRLLQAIEEQTGGRMKREHFFPNQAEHALCSMHGDFLLKEDASLQPLSRAPDPDSESCGCSCDSGASSDQARERVAERWSFPEASKEPKESDAFDRFLARLESYRFQVSAMCFQDVWNVDLERLRRCYIIEWEPDKKRMVPFCAYNLTSSLGKNLHRS